MTFVCIDPGIQGSGLAVFNGKDLMPAKTAVFKAKSVKETWINRASEIVDQLEDFLLDNLSIKKAYIELPTFFTSAKGASCATGKNGDDSDLVKLSVLIGRFYELFLGLKIEVEFIRVNDWKCQLPKEVVIQRISRRLKCSIDTFPNHAADAVGMGLWVLGVFAANSS